MRPVVHLFILMICAGMFYACDRSGNNRLRNEYLTTSFKESFDHFSYSNELWMAALENKLYDPGTRFKAEFLLPKAKRIINFSESLLRYIDACKANLQSLQQNEPLKRLYERFQLYADSLLNLDEVMRKHFEHQLLWVGPHSADSLIMLFGGANNEEKVVLLNALKQRVVAIEGSVLKYCSDLIPPPPHECLSYMMITGQNSMQFRNGDTLEITAGIGTFSRKANPIFKINNKQVLIGEDNVFHSTIKVKGKPGTYIVPITASYWNEDGIRTEIARNIKYTIQP